VGKFLVFLGGEKRGTKEHGALNFFSCFLVHYSMHSFPAQAGNLYNLKAKHPKPILRIMPIDNQRTITSEAKLSGVLIDRY